MANTSTTLRGFTEYNLTTKEYNTLEWSSYDLFIDDEVLNEFCLGSKVTIDSQSYIRGTLFKTVRFNFTNNKDKLSNYKRAFSSYHRLSDQKFNKRFELTIDEAADAIYNLEEVPEYLYNSIDMDDYDEIRDYVIRHYESLGPIYEEHGELII